MKYLYLAIYTATLVQSAPKMGSATMCYNADAISFSLFSVNFQWGGISSIVPAA